MLLMYTLRLRPLQRTVLWAGICLAAACGDPSTVTREPFDPAPVVTVNPPEIRAVAPGAMVAGETLTLLGSEFSPDASTKLRFEGRFEHQTGAVDTVDFEADARYINGGRLEWDFEPALPPHGFGHEVGTFIGTVYAFAVTEEGATETSDPLSIVLDIGPSLAIWSLKASGSTCPDRVVQTVVMPFPSTDRIDADFNFDFDVENFNPEQPSAIGPAPSVNFETEAIGLEPGRAAAPLQFTFAYVDLAGSPRLVEGEVDRGRTVRLEFNPGVVTVFARRQNSFPMTGELIATDANGNTLNRTVEVEFVWEVQVEYDGNVEVKELFAPVQVSGCLPGGEFGRNVSYNSGQNESRNRGFSANTSFDVATVFDIPILGSFVVELGVGLGTNTSVSSSESQSLSISGRVRPHQFGVFYRQTERLERTGRIIGRTACGDAFEAGQAFVTDWNWAPDLAFTLNESCPPAPPSNLPPAQVFQ